MPEVSQKWPKMQQTKVKKQPETGKISYKYPNYMSIGAPGQCKIEAYLKILKYG